MAVNKQTVANAKSNNILFKLNVLKFDGKYLCNDNDNAIDNAPPDIIWYCIDYYILLNVYLNYGKYYNYYLRDII